MAEWQDKARQAIADLATRMLDGSLSFIEGARGISSARVGADLVDDPDIMPFVAIDSETDSLPFGSVRDLWQPHALAALQPEIDRAEAWAKDLGYEPCKRLSKRFQASA